MSRPRSLANRIARVLLEGYDPTWSRRRWALDIARSDVPIRPFVSSGIRLPAHQIPNKGETTMTTEDFVVIRSRDSGAWLGRLLGRDGTEVQLADARRLWYWDGAATLSQLALEGVSRPNTCKFPAAVPVVTVLGVCEVIPATEAAVASVQAVAPWRA